jgi:hypothetical protein
VAKRWLDWVDFCESWLMFFLSYARQVHDGEEDFDNELDKIELGGVEQARGEGIWSSIHRRWGL